MREGVENRQLHVRESHLCQHRPVHELDERVYDRLRVHDHLDRLVGQAEQEVGLDHLERLVDEGRRIHGDLSAHLPGRVAQRLFHGRLRHALGRPGPEWPARRREDQPSHFGRAPARDALQDGAVLGVDRDDLTSAVARGAHHQLAGHDERLLVRERDPLPRRERRQRRRQPRRPDDPVHHDVHVRAGGGFDQTIDAGPHSASGIPHPAIHDPDIRRPPLGRLPFEQSDVRVPRQGGNAKPVLLPCQYLEGRAPDRAGRTEDRDPDAHATPKSRNSAALTGRAK